jgi:hypothetical protein
MGNDEKSISGIPVSGILAAIALILGIIVIPQLPFKASRPAPTQTAKSIVHEGEDVQARLWQDPFSAVLTHGRNMASDAPDHGINQLAKQIVFKANQSKGLEKQIMVMGVMVSGGPYAENVESRTRYRYAVLSALGVLQYVPEDSEHIGYFENIGTSQRFVEMVPYEWFQSEKNSSPPVLVLWLDDGRFFGTPLRKISDLTGALNGAVESELLIPCAGIPELQYRILGPSSSTNLKEMIDEAPLDSTHKKNLKNVQMFSWAATVDMEKLVPLQKNGKKAPTTLDNVIKTKHGISAQDGFKFSRTIGPDRILTDLLVKELGLRIEGLKPEETEEEGRVKAHAEEKKVHIALISEWDTVYGRNLPDAFIKSVTANVHPYQKPMASIHKFSYMRGIDGQVPGQKQDQNPMAQASKTNNTDPVQSDIERPVGRNQFDYLRRLAFRMKKLDEDIRRDGDERGIQAIGVLGSDVYDKLLVLQAIHKLFPAAIFFTTDMDARLFHPDELSWTQNLIVASYYGLCLENNLQSDVPPFRDNYQTSLFVSTRVALGDRAVLPVKDGKGLAPPRIFEIGRSGAFPLSFMDEDRPRSRYIHPPPSLHGGTWIDPFYFWTSLGAALLFAIFFLLSYDPFWKRENITGIEAYHIYRRSPCFLILFLLLLFAAFWIIIYSQPASGEPFAFFEGISIWPSEFLRFLAGGLSIYFLIKGFFKARSSDEKLFDQFFRPASAGLQKRDVDAGKKGGVKPSKNASAIWDEYQKYVNRKARLRRILPIGAAYLLLCHTIIFMFGEPFTPYRDGTSFLIDKIALLFSIPLFILLLISVVDFTISSSWLIRRLSRVGVIWPREAKLDMWKEFKMDPEYLDEWVDMEAIVKISETAGQFIYYPFIVILILGASRLRYFDKWNMPLGLLIVILLGLAYSVYCAVSLRHAARKAREAVLHRLWKRELGLKHLNDRVLSEQIKTLYDAIKSMRKGAFVPFFEQPVVRAVALFLGGGGSLVALNYL